VRADLGGGLPATRIRWARGGVPDEPAGDVFLVIDNYAALTDDISTLPGKEQFQAEINNFRPRSIS
jgi:hypothetical protein